MVEITKGSGAKPKYLQLSDWLRGMIEKGRYSIGERLPSEMELSQMFSLNRNTVRQAIQQLVNDGLVLKKNGVGTFVTSRIDDRFEYSLKNITSLSHEFSKLGITPGTRIISRKVIRPTDDLSEKLMLGGDPRAIQIKRLRYGNGIPLVLERSYLSYREYRRILDMDLPESFYQLLVREFGVHLDHSMQTLRSIQLPDKDAQLLEVEAGFPATLQESIIYDRSNITVELLHSCYRGDKFVFKVESGSFSPTNIP